MPLSTYVSYTTTGTKASINLDPSICPFNASVGVTLSSTGTYGIQYSLSPIDTADGSSNWFDDANLPAGTAASGTTNYMFPVTKIRIVIAAIGVSSTIALEVLQGISSN